MREKLTGDVRADPGEMWMCGRSLLPRIADVYSDAHAAVTATTDDWARFARHGQVSGVPVSATVAGQVYPHWDALRDEFLRILKDSALQARSAGDALVQMANEYAATDAASAAELRDGQRAYGHDKNFPLEDQSQRPVLLDPL